MIEKDLKRREKMNEPGSPEITSSAFGQAIRGGNMVSNSLQAYTLQKKTAAVGEQKRERFKSPTKFLSGLDEEE